MKAVHKSAFISSVCPKRRIMLQSHLTRPSALRLFAFALSVLLLCPILVGCGSASGSRSDFFTSESDLPVLGDGTESSAGEDKPDDRPMVAMTFDDGPHNVRTKLIVDELNKYGYHATFFVVGNRVDGTEYAGGEAMVYAIEAGNEIGIHGYTHLNYYDSCTDEEYRQELSFTESAIRERYHAYPISLMRPVGGKITEDRVNECPYAVIKWDVDSEDWRYKSLKDDDDFDQNVNIIVENVLSSVREGSIILLHDIHESTLYATIIILERLHEMGYNVVTVSELLSNDLAPGTVYHSGY